MEKCDISKSQCLIPLILIIGWMVTVYWTWGGNNTGIAGSNVCPFGLCGLSRRKSLHGHVPRNGKDLRLCPAVNVACDGNKSQRVTSLGSLPLDFLPPEWEGRSLYVLKATKTNKQLGCLWVAEGVIVSAVWVEKLLISVGYPSEQVTSTAGEIFLSRVCKK